MNRKELHRFASRLREELLLIIIILAFTYMFHYIWLFFSGYSIEENLWRYFTLFLMWRIGYFMGDNDCYNRNRIMTREELESALKLSQDIEFVKDFRKEIKAGEWLSISNTDYSFILKDDDFLKDLIAITDKYINQLENQFAAL